MTTKTTKQAVWKKVLSAVGFALSVLIFLMAATVFVFGIKAKNNDKPLTLFGYSFSIVVSASMEPEISVGDFLAVKSYDFYAVQVGDNIVYTNQDTSSSIYGQNVVHQVVEVSEDENGRYLVTKGVNNTSADRLVVREDNFVGIEAFHSTALGKIVLFFTRIENWIFIIVLIILIPLMIKLIKKIVLYCKEAKQDKQDNAQ
jgi:signal peptidase I